MDGDTRAEPTAEDDTLPPDAPDASDAEDAADTPAAHRRGLRWSLLTLVGLVAVVGIGMGLYAYRVAHEVARVERTIVVPLPTQTTALLPTDSVSATSVNRLGIIPSATAAPRATTVDTPTPATENPTPMPLPIPTELPPTPSPSPPPVVPPTLLPMPTPAPTASLSAVQVLRGASGAATSDSDGHEAVWGGKRVVHILLLGIDRRPDDPDPPRSDTMMIASVDLWNGVATLFSIPRDLVVNIPGWGEDRVNAAFVAGEIAHPNDPAAGPAMAVRTVSEAFGVPIDHYILVDFRGFRGIVDAVGGVDIVVNRAIDDPAYPTDDYRTMHVRFVPGKQHMDGERALEYARSRHDSNDDDRRDRQMQVMQAVLDRMMDFDGARRLPDLITSLGTSVQTSIPFDGQVSLAQISRRVQANGVARYSIKPPLVRDAITQSGAEVYLGDWFRIRQLAQEAADPKRQDGR